MMFLIQFCASEISDHTDQLSLKHQWHVVVDIIWGVIYLILKKKFSWHFMCSWIGRLFWGFFMKSFSFSVYPFRLWNWHWGCNGSALRTVEIACSRNINVYYWRRQDHWIQSQVSCSIIRRIYTGIKCTLLNNIKTGIFFVKRQDADPQLYKKEHQLQLFVGFQPLLKNSFKQLFRSTLKNDCFVKQIFHYVLWNLIAIFKEE